MKNFTVYIHVYSRGVDKSGAFSLDSLSLTQEISHDSWETNWTDWGTLLVVQKVVISLPEFDHVKVEIDRLQAEITSIEGKAFTEVKQRKDRINDLLMIGYDGGSVVVVEEVENAE